MVTADDTTSSSPSEATADKKVKKLQIGVKKRVENCDRKSSKGDILHIHYRVSTVTTR
jgi:hypothetical protein